MKKAIAGILVILLTVGGTAGCTPKKAPQQQPKPEEPPKVTITIGEKQIEHEDAKIQWNYGFYDREDTFQTILKKKSEVELPDIEIGKTAVIDFGDTTPEQLEIRDFVLSNIDRSGKQVFFDRTLDVTVPFKQNSGKYTFTIGKNTSSAASSAENKKMIRGFRIIASWKVDSWGDNKCEYAFLVKTDAK